MVASVVAAIVSFSMVGQALAAPIFMSSEVPNLFTNCAVLGTCVVYVDASYALTDANGSKEKPFQEISDAVAKVNGSSTFKAIFVAEGTYATEALPLKFADRYVEVRGGYFANFASNDPQNHASIIQANSDPIIFSYANSGGVIDGFQLTGAGAPGFLGSGYTVKIENTGATKYTVLIQNNQFNNNNAGFGVSGVAAKATGSNKIYISNNRFQGNIALGSILSAEGNTVVSKNYFFQNTSSLGVVSCKAGSVVANNVLVNNAGSYLVFANGSCFITHNSLVNNELVDGIGYAAVFTTSNDNVVTNNLIAQTRGNQTFARDAGDNSVPENNGFSQNVDDPVLANGNFACDPKFSPSNPNDVGSYALGNGSDCVDRGKAQVDPQTDFLNKARNTDGNGDGTVKADAGAFEATKFEVIPAPKLTDVNLSVSTITADQKTSNLNISTNAEGKLSVQILKGAIEMNRLMDAVTKPAGTQATILLDGKDKNGDMLADGDYTLRITLQNALGVDAKDLNFSINAKVVVLPPAQTCEGFVDVAASDVHCEAIKYVKSKGIFKGYSDGSFKPDAVINRAETVKVSLIGLGKTIETSDGTNLGFSDADSKQWYIDYIQTAKNLGVIKGYKDGTVRPAQQVIRSEMLKIFFATTGKDYSSLVVTQSPYLDVPVDGSADWYIRYAQLAKNYNLVVADAKGNFSPELGMKRVDVAELFYRYAQAGL